MRKYAAICVSAKNGVCGEGLCMNAADVYFVWWFWGADEVEVSGVLIAMCRISYSYALCDRVSIILS